MKARLRSYNWYCQLWQYTIIAATQSMVFDLFEISRRCARHVTYRSHTSQLFFVVLCTTALTRRLRVSRKITAAQITLVSLELVDLSPSLIPVLCGHWPQLNMLRIRWRVKRCDYLNIMWSIVNAFEVIYIA
jgi:hypothetical protein